MKQFQRLNLTSTNAARHFILFESVVQGLRIEDAIDDSTLYLGHVDERVHCADRPCVVTSWYLDT